MQAPNKSALNAVEAVRNFIDIADVPTAFLHAIFDEAYRLRDLRSQGKTPSDELRGKTLAVIFEKPSLRTRVSFEQAMNELGGHAIILDLAGQRLGERESVPDVARVLEGMVHGVAARVFEHDKLHTIAKNTCIPVINALSDFSHPCQALADMMTMIDEFGRDLTGRTLTFIGDGNNVARSLAVICGKMGLKFILASPAGYEFEATFVDRLMAIVPTMDFELTTDAKHAVAHADAIYTDTWISMGEESQAASKLPDFESFQVNSALLARAPKEAIVLHCLPAHRGQEITDAVIDGSQSRVFPQAHNRLHAQKGLLSILLK